MNFNCFLYSRAAATVFVFRKFDPIFPARRVSQCKWATFCAAVTMVTIKEQFDEFGLEPSDEIVEKCIQICNRHGVVDPVEFVEQWFAYSCSKLGGAEPMLDNLRDMESHEYANRSRKTAANPSLARVRHGEVAIVASSSGSGGSRASTSGLEAGDLSGRSGGGGGGGSGGLVIYSNAEENEVENEVLGSYGCHTPKLLWWA
ncbi:hypothetical protein pipiens_002716 [Culex pipiens pipiens]|uniref:DNA polymerase alpha subunit B N-terminal domain-containing protein n=1 Tax=Culex pipiens pipiens TaxID=38569 RepID=A0ABD1D9G2_CULPP